MTQGRPKMQLAPNEMILVEHVYDWYFEFLSP